MANERRRILVVDDDEDIRLSMRFLFEEAGYLVEEASDGEHALNTLLTSPLPRVVLLDQMMPGGSGMDVLIAIDPLEDVRARTRILFSTARSEPLGRQLDELLTAVSAVVLAKPFNLDAILGATERAWNTLSPDAPDRPH